MFCFLRGTTRSCFEGVEPIEYERRNLRDKFCWGYFRMVSGGDGAPSMMVFGICLVSGNFDFDF